MNAVSPPPAAAGASTSSADPAGDAVCAAIVQAKALTPGAVLGPQALVASVAADLNIPVEMFGYIAKAMGDATKGDATTYRKQMEKGRAALDPSAAASSGGTRAPSGMANPDAATAPDPLASVLDQMTQAFRRQVICSEHAVIASSLWTAATYGFQGGSIFPRLAITSATKRCGKSTLLATVAALASTPLKADNVSAAAVFRIIERCRPTLLADEVDAYLRQNDELRGVLNAGFEATGAVLRMVPKPDGTFDPAEFNVYCPVVLAGIGGIPETVLDRSIVIPLERAAARGSGATGANRLAPWRRRQLGALRQHLAPHLVAHAPAIEAALGRGVPPATMPHGLSDRAQDAWEPLLALADLAGGTWPQRARAAAVALSGSGDAAGVRERLLADLREIIGADRSAMAQQLREWLANGRKGARPTMSRYARSAELVLALHRMEGHGWTEFGKHRQGITPDSLATLLRPFNVRPTTQRVPVSAPGHPLQRGQAEPAKVYDVPRLRGVFRQYLG